MLLKALRSFNYFNRYELTLVYLKREGNPTEISNFLLHFMKRIKGYEDRKVL